LLWKIIENAIEVKGLKKSYKNLEVLKGIDLTVKKGTMLALLGPNGAGKTTTVRILSTLLDYDGGTVFVHGFDLKKDAKKVRGVIGLTGQYAAVDEYLSGRENLEMMGRLYHLGKERSKTRAQELLAQFDLVDAAERAAKTYSGGMRRRLDLAASLVAMPPIIFLDEPTTGLDPRSRITMWEIIQKLKDDGATILLTTQYLEEADKLADEIAVIDHGKVIARGTPDQLKSNVGSERIELTIHEKSDFQKAASLIVGNEKHLDEKARSISLATSGSVSDLKKVLDVLSNNGIEIDAVSMHKPTLDDVFLHLTGKEVSVGESQETK
jgi:ABC-2 type transport system ATP-binding protein